MTVAYSAKIRRKKVAKRWDVMKERRFKDPCCDRLFVRAVVTVRPTAIAARRDKNEKVVFAIRRPLKECAIRMLRIVDDNRWGGAPAGRFNTRVDNQNSRG